MSSTPVAREDVAHRRGTTLITGKFAGGSVLGLAAPLIVAVLSGAFLTHTFFPGFMSYDSLHQWSQVNGTAEVTDAHPVTMVLLWRWLDSVMPGPGSLLIFHQILYWTSLLILVTTLARSWWMRTALILVIGWWPPLAIHSIHLWKDVGMLGGLLLATAATLHFAKSGRWGWCAIALAGLFYSIAARHNAITAAAPMYVLLAGTALAKKTNILRRTTRKLSLFLLSSAAVTLGAVATFANYAAVSAINRTAPHVNVMGFVQIWDMAAITIQIKRNILPEYIEVLDNSAPLLSRLRATYNPTNALATATVVSFSPPQEYESRLTADWLRAINRYPSEYLRHRMTVFKELVGWGRETAYYPFTPGIDPNEFNFHFANISKQQEARYLGLFDFVASTPLYKGWIYLMLAGLGILVCAAQWLRGKGSVAISASFCLFSSALLTAVPLVVFGPAPDFRYILWAVAATLIALIILCREVLRSRNSRGMTGDPLSEHTVP